MNQNERKTVVRRMILLIAVACVIMGLYVMRLIFLQLVNGDGTLLLQAGKMKMTVKVVNRMSQKYGTIRKSSSEA